MAEGIYVLRANLTTEQANAAAGRTDRSLAQVDRAFRCIKTSISNCRRCCTGPRHGRAYVLLRMVTLERPTSRLLALMLVDDHDKPTGIAEDVSPVAKAGGSKAAYAEAPTPRTVSVRGETHPVHSCRSLLADLATLN